MTQSNASPGFTTGINNTLVFFLRLFAFFAANPYQHICHACTPLRGGIAELPNSGCETLLAIAPAVGEYHGDLKTTMPWGLPESGRHPGQVRGARDHRFSYIRDPDYGDEAYNLQLDPRELRNLLQNGASVPQGVDSLRRQMDKWEKQCDDHRDHLGVIEGDRNFNEPLPAVVASALLSGSSEKTSQT